MCVFVQLYVRIYVCMWCLRAHVCGSIGMCYVISVLYLC